MRAATVVALLVLASIFGVLVFGDLFNVPAQEPIAPYPSMEEVIGDARPTWGAAYINSLAHHYGLAENRGCDQQRGGVDSLGACGSGGTRPSKSSVTSPV